MWNEMRENVLIDPSLLVVERTFYRVIKNIHRAPFNRRKYQFFIPSRFIQILHEIQPNTKDLLFFVNKAKMVSLKELKDTLEKEKMIQEFEIPQNYKENFVGFYESLLHETKSQTITEILFEEWIFLQKKSWIVSRIKKAFNYFVKAGAVSIEFSRKTLDSAVKKTLKKDSKDIITNADRLRAFAKWISVGGPSILSFLNPRASAISSVAAGYYLLIDPADENVCKT